MRRVKRVKRRLVHDAAWHDAEMALGYKSMTTGQLFPWRRLSEQAAERIGDDDIVSNSPTDVFSFIQMRGKDECWPWTGPYGGRASDRRPYFQAGGKRRIAYRWVYELVHGPLDDSLLILHSCDQGGYPIGCCNPKHMRTGTHDENMTDMTERQRHGLSHHVVKAIRRLLEQGQTQQEIARLYGLSREAVSAIATGRTYGHLGDRGTEAGRGGTAAGSRSEEAPQADDNEGSN